MWQVYGDRNNIPHFFAGLVAIRGDQDIAGRGELGGDFFHFSSPSLLN